ncbi:MAG: glycosyltransferase family 2 protein [Nitrospirae bacterium]|nr:glycosyltransferase family 2 protein [Nitrospirota bacterium]
MSSIKLSICIPTYNFGEFIGETLSSVIDQSMGRKDVEIVVLDGGSTDNTAEVVLGFKTRFPSLIYHRLEQKGGIDNDLSSCVDLATGEYCWLLSSDDVPVQGAIGRMFSEITSKDDIYLFNRIECDGLLSPLRTRLWLDPEIIDRSIRFYESCDYIDYFGHSKSLGALFSYISSIVVSRSVWCDCPAIKESIGTNYAHVGRLFSVLQRGGSLRYIREPLVLCRGYNDSFLQRGLISRLLIDIDGYMLLSSHLFADYSVRMAFLGVMKQQHKWYVFVEMRSLIQDKSLWQCIAKKLMQVGYPKWNIFLIELIGAFRIGVSFARLIINGYRKVQFFLARLRK